MSNIVSNYWTYFVFWGWLVFWNDNSTYFLFWVIELIEPTEICDILRSILSMLLLIVLTLKSFYFFVGNFLSDPWLVVFGYNILFGVASATEDVLTMCLFLLFVIDSLDFLSELLSVVSECSVIKLRPSDELDWLEDGAFPPLYGSTSSVSSWLAALLLVFYLPYLVSAANGFKELLLDKS